MTESYILVVDDDTRLRRLLGRYLRENGFRVAMAPSADEAAPLIALIQFDLIVMDVMMPGTNGYDMVRRLRSAGEKTPVLMLTAMGTTDDRITGLEAGADDYLGKPFEPRELILRINNILRRVQNTQSVQQIAFGTCVFEPKTGVLTRAGRAVPLTGAETELLRILAAHIGEPVARAELKSLTTTDNDRAVDVLVTRVRKKVEPDLEHPICIQTVRGQGYMLVS